MCPEPDDAPARYAQSAIRLRVTLAVSEKLWNPVRLIRAGFTTVFRAAVPEAAIDEDGEALAPEGEIWAAWQGLVAAPTREAGGAENGSEPLFGVLVASRANGGHDLAALFLGEDVWHGFECSAING